ncbi:MAG TPA: hypothetical protein VJN96_07965 [Vicinamibacterales bacterium]|nr:hypothetical protein [Vicinamibacterales bacterium]
MIDREVPRDAKQPRPDLAVARGRYLGSNDANKDVLRQFLCGVGLSNRPAQVLKQPLSVLEEQRFGVSH